MNFKKMTFLCMQKLTNFPYIEADFDALTNYELLCKVVEYLNKVIANENIQNEALNELATAFNNLKEFVDNYFDNLDVQDEINNKLDEMAESGQLTDIIAQYLGLAGMIAFDTVADMKLAENLVNGSKCRTLGYHSVNDGGGAYYKIRQVTNDDVIDEMTIIEVYDNLLVAELIINDSISPEMLGAYGDGIHDDTIPLRKCLEQNAIIELSKEYLTSEKIRIGDNDNITINGEKSTINYSGNDYAFLIQHINGGNIHFGKIVSDNGGCIELNSVNGTSDRVQYLNLSFNHLRGYTKNIYGYVSSNGWLNEITLTGGYMTRGDYGIYLDNQSSETGGIGAWKYNNIGFEGTSTNIYLNAKSGTRIRGHYFENIRYVENTTSTLFETHGNIERLTCISWGGLEESRLNLETNKLYNFKLLLPLYYPNTAEIFANGLYYNGNRKRYIYEQSIYELPTKASDVTSGSIRHIKVGNIHILRFNDIVVGQITGNLINSGQLNELPLENFNACLIASDTSANMRVTIDTSGVVSYRVTTANLEKTFYGELVYYTGVGIIPS